MPYGQYSYSQQQPFYGSQYDGSWDEGYDQYGHGGNFGGYGGQGGPQGGGRGGEKQRCPGAFEMAILIYACYYASA